jgi:hypothetical protein
VLLSGAGLLSSRGGDRAKGQVNGGSRIENLASGVDLFIKMLKSILYVAPSEIFSMLRFG